VIRFRWGYKATKRDVKTFGDSVFLNEDDYWGGGPFANGCSALADLWTDGLNDRLFLWLTAQHLNPVPGRDVYHCPHRAYYAFAALRLARLLKSIRDKQADCPITVVCHSQGNMVGLAAAFLADRLGIQADNYVLCNPPLSLVDKNGTEDWVQRYTTNRAGQSGRVGHGARLDTLANFFDLLRARAGCEPPAERVDKCMANPQPADGSPGFTAASDRQQSGLDGRHTHGRVTLYCNPHDQVISADSVQGIGWRGMSADEIAQTGGAGVFSQRVFAHAYPVGEAGGKDYDFWAERNKRDPDPYPGSFWIPPSPPARYSLQQGSPPARASSARSSACSRRPCSSSPPRRSRPGSMPTRQGLEDPDQRPGAAGALPARGPALREVLKEFDASWDPAGQARNRNRADAPPDDPTPSTACTAPATARLRCPAGQRAHRSPAPLRTPRPAAHEGPPPGQGRDGRRGARRDPGRQPPARTTRPGGRGDPADAEGLRGRQRHRPLVHPHQPDARREGAGLRRGDRGVHAERAGLARAAGGGGLAVLLQRLEESHPHGYLGEYF
jgi:hypothetical protein